MVNRRSDDTFRGARDLQFNRTIRDSLGQRDRIDFYKFRASGQVNFNLALNGLQTNASVRLLNSRRVPVAVSNQPGNRAERISATLNGGLYYIQVQFLGRRGTTRYNLRTSARPTPNPTPVGDNTLTTATDIGTLTTTIIRSDVVGPEDTVDFYKFTLNDIANLQVRVNTTTAGAGIELIWDANSNGLVDTGEVLDSDRSFSGNALASFTEDLPSGTYFFRVTNSNTTATQYSLNVIPTFFSGNISSDPGNTLPTARDLGVFSGTFSAREYVGPVDPADIYRISLNDLSKLEITRTGPSREAEIQVIRDINNNGLIDSGEVLVDDNQFGILSNRATVDLPVGNYFILVEPEFNNNFPTSYQMDLVVTPYGGNGLPDPGNSLPTARDLGILSGTVSLREYVGLLLDPSDFYRFTASGPTNLQARLTTSDDDLNLNLIQDTNNNGFIDANEILLSGTTSFTGDVPAGNYFLRVEPRFAGGNRSANYELTLVAT